VLAEVARYGAVGGFGFEGLAVGGDEDGGHEAEGAETLGDDVGLYVAVVVWGGGVLVVAAGGGGEMCRRTLQSHNVPALTLHHLSNHVIDQTVLIPDLLLLELPLVFRLVYLLKQILEPSIVRLEYRVLRAHVQRQSLLQRQLETRMRKPAYAIVRVILRLCHASAVLEIKNFYRFSGPAGRWAEHHFERAVLGDDFVFGAVLVAKGVAADDDGLFPAWDETRDAWDDDGFAEDRAAEMIPDGAVGAQPHFLEVELLHPLLIGRYRCAFHTDAVLLDSFCGVEGHLVGGSVAVGEAEVVVFEVDVEVFVDEFVFDVLPDDAGHFIAVKLDERVLDFDLLDAGHFAVCLIGGGGDGGRGAAGGEAGAAGCGCGELVHTRREQCSLKRDTEEQDGGVDGGADGKVSCLCREGCLSRIEGGKRSWCIKAVICFYELRNRRHKRCARASCHLLHVTLNFSIWLNPPVSTSNARRWRTRDTS